VLDQFHHVLDRLQAALEDIFGCLFQVHVLGLGDILQSQALQARVHDVVVQFGLLGKLLAETQEFNYLALVVGLVHLAVEEVRNIGDQGLAVSIDEGLHQFLEGDDLLQILQQQLHLHNTVTVHYKLAQHTDNMHQILLDARLVPLPRQNSHQSKRVLPRQLVEF